MSNVSDSLIAIGYVFHSFGPTVRNPLSPKVLRLLKGTEKLSEEWSDDLRLRVGI